MARTPIASLVFLAAAAAASAQSSLLRIDGFEPNVGFGQSVNAAGDVNGDGVPDIIVGSPADSTVLPLAGSVLVVSGVDGSTLFRLEGTELARFGSDAEGLGDVNGDGVDDFAVGAPEDSSEGFKRGLVYVYSGVDGSLVRTIQGPRINGLFGTEVVGMGDLDGDGVTDLAVGARTGALGPLRSKGSILLHSGATGALLRAIEGPFDDSQYGLMVAPAGDFDGDGLDDVLISAPLEDSVQGAVRVHSSADGSVLFELSSTFGELRIGTSALTLPDQDGDSIPEVLVNRRFPSTAQAFSGASGVLLWEAQLITTNQVIFERFGDRDGDGIEDFLSAEGSSQIQVRSGANGDVLESRLRSTPFGSGEVRNQVCVVGDLNLDGAVDYAVGASGQLDVPLAGVSAVGTVYVFSGSQPIHQDICFGPFGSPDLLAQGSLDPSDNRMTLTVTGLRDDAFGYFITSLGNEVIVRPGGAFSDICIGDSVGGIGRHLDSLAQPFRDRTVQFHPDLSQLPTPTGAVQAMAGETRYWQHWSRFVDFTGAVGSIFSNGIAVDFR